MKKVLVLIVCCAVTIEFRLAQAQQNIFERGLTVLTGIAAQAKEVIDHGVNIKSERQQSYDIYGLKFGTNNGVNTGYGDAATETSVDSAEDDLLRKKRSLDSVLGALKEAGLFSNSATGTNVNIVKINSVSNVNVFHPIPTTAAARRRRLVSEDMGKSSVVYKAYEGKATYVTNDIESKPDGSFVSHTGIHEGHFKKLNVGVELAKDNGNEDVLVRNRRSTDVPLKNEDHQTLKQLKESSNEKSDIKGEAARQKRDIRDHNSAWVFKTREEKYTDFSSDIEVKPDGSTVTHTAEGTNVIKKKKIALGDNSYVHVAKNLPRAKRSPQAPDMDEEGTEDSTGRPRGGHPRGGPGKGRGGRKGGCGGRGPPPPPEDDGDDEGEADEGGLRKKRAINGTTENQTGSDISDSSYYSDSSSSEYDSSSASDSSSEESGTVDVNKGGEVTDEGGEVTDEMKTEGEQVQRNKRSPCGQGRVTTTVAVRRRKRDVTPEEGTEKARSWFSNMLEVIVESAKKVVEVTRQVFSSGKQDGMEEKKNVLNGVSGKFNSGELTAIMGPSGAGKSSLLNILTGYTKTGVKGSLNIGSIVGGNKLCSYILQEDNLHPFFTVHEIMTMACDLKISSRCLNHDDKQRLIDDILDTLHLKFTKLTRCGNLSGGQKKRLSIALELIDNPPVLFLDEPTTGLDSSSSLYTIKLLQGLAREGRTIVCTIHQPSATVFEMFDHVYALAEGHCVYQGSAHNTVPYLCSVGLQCPQYHNAADYLLEVANKEYGNCINVLAKAAIDCHWRKPEACIGVAPLPHYLAYDRNHNGADAPTKVYHSTVLKTDGDEECSIQRHKQPQMRKPSEFAKLLILMKRCNVQLYRDWTVTHLKLFFHVVCAIVVGLLFGDSGINGTKSVSNIASFLVHVLYLWYTTLMPGVLKFPSEMKILRKESFNNWYKIRTYFIATMLTTLPVQIFFSIVYSTIVFTLTSQPLECDRFLMFLAVLILTTIVADGYGLFLGTFLNQINGTFIGAITTCYMLVFCGFLILFSHMSELMKAFSYLSTLRYGLEALVLSVYDNGRSNMVCPEEELYCHYVKASTILKDLGMAPENYQFNVVMLAIQFVAIKLVGFWSLKRKLKSG